MQTTEGLITQTPTPAVDRGRPWGAIGGVAFVALLVASFLAAPSLPHADATSASISRYFVDHRSGVLAGGALTSLAAVAFLWFAGTLRHVLRSSGASDDGLSSVMLLGAATLSSMVIASNSILWGLAERTTTGANPDTTGALFAIAIKAYSAVDIGGSVFFAAAGILILRSHRLPRWLGVLPLVVGALAVIDAVAGAAVSNGPFALFGPTDSAATLGFLVWVLATSVSLLRTSSPSS